MAGGGRSHVSPAKVLIVGGGGIGTITALNLVQGCKTEVSMVLRSNYGAVTRNGYHIKSVDHGFITGWRPHHVLPKVPDISSSDAEPFQYIVCTMKNIMDTTPSALDIIRPAVTPSVTTIVLIQNGLNIERPYISTFPSNVVLSGISYMGSHERVHGLIEQEYPDELALGIFRNGGLDDSVEKSAAGNFMTLYGASGKTKITFVEDVSLSRWTKLLYNATINPLSAILQMNSGTLHESRAVKNIACPAMDEIRAIAAAKGIVIDDSTLRSIADMSFSDPNFEPSMCVDVIKGNLLEFESIIGEPVREAREMGVAAPTLDVLYNMCQALQWRIRTNRHESV